MYWVNAFAEESSDEAAGFVVSADIPIVWERVFTREELDAYPESSWLPEGFWCIDRGDQRVKDFPPEDL